MVSLALLKSVSLKGVGGSTPLLSALCGCRLVVRTGGSQPSSVGSIPITCLRPCRLIDKPLGYELNFVGANPARGLTNREVCGKLGLVL